MWNKIARNVTLGAINYDAHILVGSTGAVTSYDGAELKAVTKETTVGQYTIELCAPADYSFIKVLALKANVKGTTLNIAVCQLLSDTLATDNKLVIQLVTTGGSEINVASGNQIDLDIVIQTSIK